MQTDHSIVQFSPSKIEDTDDFSNFKFESVLLQESHVKIAYNNSKLLKRLENKRITELQHQFFKNYATDCSECALCMKNITSKHFPSIINKALFRRYCSSLNYFYTKDISKILSKSKSSA